MPTKTNEAVEENVVKLGNFQKFLYLFIIPLIFTFSLTAVLGSALGIFDFSPQLNNAQMWLHNLPVVGAWIPEPEPLLTPESALEQQRKEVAAAWVAFEEEKAIQDAKARDLDAREKQFAEAVQRFNQEQQTKQNREKRIAGLVEKFEAMKADGAGLIFNELDEETAVEILLNMDNAKASKILLAMDPEKAARLTQKMQR